MTVTHLLRLHRAALVGALLASSAVVGCDCGEKALVGHAPKIVVTPDPVNVTSANSGAVGQVVLAVRNTGTADLIISPTPSIIDASTGIQFDVTSVFVTDCTGAARHGTLTTIETGQCAEISVRYLPSADGTYTAKLSFVSNDFSDTPLNVPITIAALTPHIQACDLSGTTNLGCNTDGLPLGVTFGTTAIAVGSTGTQTIQLNSLGTKAVTLSSAQLTGDPDFSISPGASTFTNASIAPSAMSSLTLTFAPLLGGPRVATLVFDTDDPKNPALTINIIAQGDGPALCYCIGMSATACENTSPTVNFMQVGVNTSAVLNLYLNDCGTEPLTFTAAEITTGTPPFTAMNLPTSGTVIQPQQTIAIPITFAPTTTTPSTGALSLTTADGEKPLFTLEGTGVNSGCNLQGEATVLDFGQVATGQTATQQFVVANTGTQPCYFPMPPAITAQSTPGLFAVATYPLQALAPSRTAQIGVTYVPVSGSGTDTGTMTVYYADAASGAQTLTIPVALKGEPVATPTCKLKTQPNATSMFGGALNFGEVGVNRPKTLPVVIDNVGSATCTLGKATVVPGLFGLFPGVGPTSAFTVTTQPATTLPPGGSTQITVQFLPTQEEQYGSPFGMIGLNVGGPTIQIETSDTVTFNGSACGGISGSGTAGCAAWGISGEGVESTIQVLPGQLDFGEITLGCNSPQETVTIYNVGNAVIHVTGFSLDPAPPPTIFAVDTNGPTPTTAAPWAIPAGGSKSFTVVYTPTMMGIQTATLYIESDAVVSGTSGSGSNPYVSVPLTGTGVTDSMQTDVFHQLTQQQVDVLWVIDQDANSMGDKQQQIAQNTASFLQAATAANTDYHLGVISNWDVMAKAEPSSNPPNMTVTPATLYNVSAPQAWVQPSDPNPSSEFAQNVMIGTNSDSTGNESGLQAMYQALSAPIINAANNGFLRDTASLVVISISDDDDQSPYPTNFYAAFLQSLKPGNPAAAIFDTIGGELPNGCNDPLGGDGTDDAPERYSEVSMATGGKLYDMCTGNWNQIAADLSLGSFGGQTHFVLSRPCDPSTLTVTVGSTSQVMGTDYTFNATLNSIDFTSSSVPPGGSTITATYDALCL